MGGDELGEEAGLEPRGLCNQAKEFTFYFKSNGRDHVARQDQRKVRVEQGELYCCLTGKKWWWLRLG